MPSQLPAEDVSVLEKLVAACGSQPHVDPSDGNLWNDLCLYAEPGLKGEPTLLQEVAEALLRQPRIRDFVRPFHSYVVPACPDAMPLAAAIHMLTGLPLPSFVTTRFGYIWLTEAPVEEGTRGTVLVVDTVLRKGAAAARAQSQLTYYVGNGRALYVVLADFFRPCNRPGESRGLVTGWPDPLFFAFLTADEHWRFADQGLPPDLTGPFLPIDELCLTPGYSIHQVVGVDRVRGGAGTHRAPRGRGWEPNGSEHPGEPRP
ncbi:MAG: hypothetical protein KKI08_26540 [Armatimonadetes bacterium]|nr:hypothetical protein [Armatimonadota bacterium]